MVIAGLSLGITHGVDLVAGLVESPLAYLLDEGWLRSLLVGLIAWPIGLIASVVLLLLPLEQDRPVLRIVLMMPSPLSLVAPLTQLPFPNS